MVLEHDRKERERDLIPLTWFQYSTICAVSPCFLPFMCFSIPEVTNSPVQSSGHGIYRTKSHTKTLTAQQSDA